MKQVVLWLMLAAAASGCSGVAIRTYDLTVRKNGCQVTETRVTMFSTSTSTVCWDGQERPIIGATVPGEPAIAVGIAVIGAGGTVLGAGALGYGMIKASENLSSVTATIKAKDDVTGHVTGNVSGTDGGTSRSGGITT